MEKHENYDILLMNHNYIIHKRAVNPHDASILIKQVPNWRDIAIPG